MLLFLLFYKWGNWGSEVNLPKAIGLVGIVPVFGAAWLIIMESIISYHSNAA